MSCCGGGYVAYQCCKNGSGYFIKKMRSAEDPPVSRLPCPSTPISCSSSSVDIRPVQYDPRTWICLPTHVSSGFWRRGNPMEVIDDCFVAFFGAIFGAILPITSHVLNSQKKNRWLEKTKKLKFYLSLMSTTLFVMSWVEDCVRKVLNSTHDKKIKYSTQLIVFTWGPGILTDAGRLS